MLQKLKFYKNKKFTITLRKLNNIYFFNKNKNIKIMYTHLIKNKAKNIFKNYFIYSFVIYIFRIVWRGKAYRIRFFKKSSKFTLSFGHSHWFKLLYNTNYFNFWKLRRQGYVVIFSNRHYIVPIRNLFNNIREYNKYNRRGIRLKKTYYLKRFGKISQVNSSLHDY